MPDPALEAAYRATDYWVEAPGGRFAIRVGELCPQLEAESWSFITACNPGSRLLPGSENAERMRRLEADVVSAGFHFLRGEGVARDGFWAPETSLLIQDIDESSAVALGRRYGQAAIVFGERGQPARLVWL